MACESICQKPKQSEDATIFDVIFGHPLIPNVNNQLSKKVGKIYSLKLGEFSNVLSSMLILLFLITQIFLIARKRTLTKKMNLIILLWILKIRLGFLIGMQNFGNFSLTTLLLLVL